MPALNQILVTDNGAVVWQGEPYPTLGTLGNRLDYLRVNGAATVGVITVTGMLDRFTEVPAAPWVIPIGTTGQVVPPSRYSRRTNALTITFGAPADATPGKVMLYARDEF